MSGARLLFVHGGGYMMGSADATASFGGQLAVRACADTFVADYRLAPEHPFPAAFDDAVAAYRALAAAGARAIAVAGESAGGGLALALLPVVMRGQDATDPRASPLFGDLAGLPPLRIDVGEDEVLLDDARRYAERAQAASVSVILSVWAGMPHVFQAQLGRLAAARLSMDEAGAFPNERLRNALGDMT